MHVKITYVHTYIHVRMRAKLMAQQAPEMTYVGRPNEAFCFV
jgi:hypothetical protein